MAAALGARVIKIEDPSGDRHRMAFGPEAATPKTTQGKESVSIDLRGAEGQLAARRIVRQADAPVTGFRSGWRTSWGSVTTTGSYYSPVCPRGL